MYLRSSHVLSTVPKNTSCKSMFKFTGKVVILVLLFVLWTVVIPANATDPHFSQAIPIAPVISPIIKEASGLCASRKHAGVLYTHNDSGDLNRIYAISAVNGSHLATFSIDGATANDWEDIACGPCPGGSGPGGSGRVESGSCIYIADTGGNAGTDANTIYRIREPDTIQDQQVPLDGTLKFSWDQHDCESVMVDPQAEVYIISKVEMARHPKLVHLPATAWDQHHVVDVTSGVFLSMTSLVFFFNPVSADISPNGTEVLLKTYGHVFYYSVPDMDYYSHMTVRPLTLPYQMENQGEAVCWDTEGQGYYTLSEGSNPILFYYRRETQLPIIG